MNGIFFMMTNYPAWPGRACELERIARIGDPYEREEVREEGGVVYAER